MVKKYTAVHGEALPVCMPEEAGLKSSCVRRFVERCDRENIRLSSFILMRDGKKFAEAYYAPYHRDSFISVHSLSKAFILCNLRLCKLYKLCESFSVINSHLRKNLSVKINISELKAVHKLAV